MKYNVKVTVKNKDDVSEKEKSDRIAQFHQAFIIAATDYYLCKQKKNTENEKSA